MEQYPVSEEQVRFYQENGYVRLDGVLGAAEVESLRSALAVAVEDRKKYDRNEGPRTDPGYAKVFLQMVNLWEHYPAVREYVQSPRIGEIARKLARARSVRLWHDHALIKYPKDSKPTVWHQDWVYWPMQQTGALSCWMALDDVTVRNGCMSFIPGS
ncbi:MAG TPA: phytanoyl-CoA dioxygenase family protein, partial [Bacteroidota bacterium]|nr:phytanoyl-CoA dioxygenase family protein [Bacteroidota bacterium]